MKNIPHIIITGINGFVGKHLAAELRLRNVVIVGIGREAAVHPELTVMVDKYYTCDLTNADDVAKLPLEQIDAVINLAGLAAVGASYGQDELYNRVNVAVLTVISERILALGLTTRMIAVSTGAVYSPDQSMPLHEGSALITSGSPYALSKIAMESEAARLRANGLSCVVARPFNHIGPGQGPGFLLPDLYQKITTSLATDGVVAVGDLTTRRDYTDVRDVVKAYADLALSETLNHEIYNICSGRSIPGNTIFTLLANAIDGDGVITAKVDQQLIRPGDPKDLYGDNTNLRAQTGWNPEIAVEKTIIDFVNSKKS